MKHLKRIFESFEEITKQDIIDNFISISDELGRPEINSFKYGNHTKWKVTWELDINFSQLQNLEIFVNRMNSLNELILDIQSAASRFEDYEINISLHSLLIIEITPKESGEQSFEFIRNYEYRTLNLNKSEIERFFRSRGVNVLDWEETFDEVNDRGDVEIILSKNDGSAVTEFKNIFQQELERKQENIFREYQCSGTGDYLTIYSPEEKAFVSLI